MDRDCLYELMMPPEVGLTLYLPVVWLVSFLRSTFFSLETDEEAINEYESTAAGA